MRYSNLIILFLAISTAHSSLQAQYYYKDIHVRRQTEQLVARYKDQQIRTVRLTSIEADGSPTEGFDGSQNLGKNHTVMTTALKTIMGGESLLTSYFDARGRLSRTTDTTDGASSVSTYQYDENGRLVRYANVSASAGNTKETEEHLWHYDANGRASRMERVKNGSDTSYITFILDEKGNVTEENTLRNRNRLPPVYYYYDDEGRLTDVATYNSKAKRPLPLYVFDYSGAGLIISMMVVPEGSDNYQRWVYTYNDSGLKTKESCYDKRKRLLGAVEYRYAK